LPQSGESCKTRNWKQMENSIDLITALLRQE
jgi:hypothetical protein